PMLFGLGLDNQAYAARLSADGTLLNGFYLVAPGQFQSLTAGQFGAGNPELFGIGLNKQIYATRFDPVGNFQNGWILVAPGQFTSAAVASRDNGGAELLAVGADQRIYPALLDANGNLAAGFFPTTSASARNSFTSVSIVNLGSGTLAAYALGTDQQVYAGAFSTSTGLQTTNYSVPRAGQVTAIATGANLFKRG